MEYWIWLSGLRGIGPIAQKKLLEYFKTPNRIYESSEEELVTVPGIGSSLAQSICEARSLDGAFSVLEELNQKKMKVLAYDDPLYPDLAKEWPEAPVVLYYMGTIRKSCVGQGIVGSRRCSAYGKQVAVEAAGYLAQKDIPVISGLAKGIDGYAHTACLKAGGYTIAFLGNGLDVYYPREHRELQASIIENGAVVSMYLPGTKPRPEHFPKRNGLISSWSRKLLVAEAANKSGALITAQLAKTLGREIFVPPHEIYRVSGQGTNQLLKNGATLYLKPEQLDCRDFLKEQFLSETNETTGPVANSRSKRKQNRTERKLTADEAKIQAVLISSEKNIQQIEALTGISQVCLIERLSIMELEGVVALSSCGCYKFLDC
ncbi:MAG: DNA-protecting protein DprA [Eubacteriaceae bacterium]|nr:DNA-protecting protein DprA [Eubacteriaceae bacterium]